jgi:trimeric autotransporter adhesin
MKNTVAMPISKSLGRLAAVFLATLALAAAAEYRGAVKCGGLPVPGAAVTAVRGEKRTVTTTDEQGAFSFKDLADGAWTIEVAMLGFGKITREVNVASGASAAEWNLTFLSENVLIASLRSGGSAPVPPRVPGTSARPPVPGGGPQVRSGYTRLDVNQSADADASASEGTITTEQAADLSQGAANSFLVQGSMSSALGIGQQSDWGLEMGGPPPPMGMGGPGQNLPGGSGPSGDGPNANATAQNGPRAGLDGPGGGPPPGGPPAGGGPPPGGGGPPPNGGGMGGPPGGGMGGPGGPGGFEGGSRAGGDRTRSGWQGRPNAMVFGNARRGPQNSYMGMASFSLNNSVWDARTFSVTGAALDKPAYASGRGNFMFGGPLQIPKLVSREKHIMFTIGYQFQRSRTGTTSDPVNMPTTLERAGNFSATSAVIYDPTTGSPFPGNIIPATRISSAATALLKYFPQPNLPYAARNYQTSWTGSNNSQNLNARLMNIGIGTKDRLSGGVAYQGSETSSPNLFQFVDTGSGRGLNANLAWSRRITTRLINNLQYTFSRNRQLSSPYFANRQNVAAELGIAGTSQNPMNWGPPNLNFTNYAGLSDGNSSLNRNQTGSASDSLTWIHGSHRWSVGGEYRRQQFNQFADTNGRGTYTFNGSATSLLIDGVAQSATGYDLADLLLGMPAASSIRYGNPDKYFRGSGYGMFVNDDWRLTSRFSLVLGFRWDYATPMSELYNRLVNLDLAPGFTALAAVEPGQTAPYSGRLPNALIRPDRNNVSPRLGFAWRPLAKGSMVVRGGYGVYYNTSVYNFIAANMAQQPPFARTLSVSNSAANPLTIENGFSLATAATAASTYAVDPKYRVGYAQTWNFSIQNDLPLGMFGTIGYLGTKGTRLDQQFLPNSVAPGAAESAWPHNFTYESSNGNSIYHAAQFQLNRRFHSGLAAHASYQFSKSIDNAGTGGRGQGGTPVAQNWLDQAAERGLSSFDARHNLSLQFQYSTGTGMAGGTLLNGWQGALIKDWTLSGNVTLRSGNPFTATVGGNRSQVAGTAVGNTVRADATGLPVQVAGLLFNTAAFSEPLAGQWGNAGRNTIPGPATFSLNGGLGRVFRFGERRSADLQFQAQNLLNRVTITSWGTVLGANNYGLAAAASPMRRITAELRFRF